MKHYLRQSLRCRSTGQINGEVMMYAANLPQCVLLAAGTWIKVVKPTKDVLSDMRLMIAKSGNQATTRMASVRLGYKKIASVLKDPNYNLYKKTVVADDKEYASSGPRFPDP
ncbi:MAG: hypothetical protein R2769_12715 [Saprospiraceae bacterium]